MPSVVATVAKKLKVVSSRARLQEQPTGRKLTSRWTPLRHHPMQRKLWISDKRFRVVPSGRRSGKTELAKRFTVKKAIEFWEFPDGRFVLAAPTHAQAKRIYWRDLKLLLPRWYRKGKPNESELTLNLINGASITVMGLDEPARVEGPPLDGIIIDEFGNMKPQTWAEHVRPALSTRGRPGWAWLIGVPEGRNHYYKAATHSQDPVNRSWGYFHWLSEDILTRDEIEEAMRDMDARTFDQEYRGSFIDFAGRIYWAYERSVHSAERVLYNPRKPLIFCFDFNVSPGTAAVLQELEYKGKNKAVAENFTGAVGEVWIPQDSNTPMVCRRLCEDWGRHKQDVYLYGDATGGARSTSQLDGTDWDIIPRYLKRTFGNRLKLRNRTSNPQERARVNAFNTRLMNAAGEIHMLVDPHNCPNIVEDLEGVVAKEGTKGEIDDKKDPMRGHITDGVGYYLEDVFPARAGVTVRTQQI